MYLGQALLELLKDNKSYNCVCTNNKGIWIDSNYRLCNYSDGSTYSLTYADLIGNDWYPEMDFTLHANTPTIENLTQTNNNGKYYWEYINILKKGKGIYRPHSNAEILGRRETFSNEITNISASDLVCSDWLVIPLTRLPKDMNSDNSRSNKMKETMGDIMNSLDKTIKQCQSNIDIIKNAISEDFIGSFSWALIKIKRGVRMTRKGWNGKGLFVVYQKGYPEGIKCNAQTAEAWGINEGDLFKCEPYLQINTVNGSHAMWVPSIGDLLANDWEEYIMEDK